MTRVIGYTRESSTSSDTESDIKALRAAGASNVCVEPRGASTRARSGLDSCMESLQPGDTLVITGALALAPSVDQFIAIAATLHRRGVAVQSLAEPALSTVAEPHVALGDGLVALDTLRRHLVSLRTREGMDAATAAGRKPGRPRVMTEDRLAIAYELRAQKRSFAQIGRALGVSEAAVRRALRTPPDGSAVQRTNEYAAGEEPTTANTTNAIDA